MSNSSDGEAVAMLIMLLLGSVFGGGWLLMLAVGVLHGWWPAIPPMGYWTAVVLMLFVTIWLAAKRIASGALDA